MKFSIIPRDKQTFVRLLRYMAFDIDMKRVFCSGNAPQMLQASSSESPRLDVVLSGCKHIVYPDGKGSRDVVMERGDCHFAPPYAMKKPIWDLPHEMSSIVLCQNSLRITYIGLKHPIKEAEIVTPFFYHTSLPPVAGILQISNLLCQQVRMPSRYDLFPLLVKTLILQVLEQVENDTPIKSHRKKDSWQQAVAYMNENFTQPLTREHVAEVLGLNPNYLSQLFMEQGGETFISYLRRIRLEYARQLLYDNPHISVNEAASACGYQSSTFFIAAFKRMFGITPGHLRLENGGFSTS